MLVEAVPLHRAFEVAGDANYLGLPTDLVVALNQAPQACRGRGRHSIPAPCIKKIVLLSVKLKYIASTGQVASKNILLQISTYVFWEYSTNFVIYD